MLLIDRYAYTNRLKDFNPQAKFFLACGGFILLRILDIRRLYILNIFTMLFLVVFFAKIPLKIYLDLFKAPLLFLIISLVTILISINGSNYLYSLDIYNFSIGFTSRALDKVIDLFFGVISSLSSIYFFILTTPMNRIIKLLKKARLPGILIELMVLIYRSIFIFLGEMRNMDTSQRLKFGYENKSLSLKSISLLIANLFRKIIIRHRDMTIALECKLYDGEFKIGD